MRLLQDGRPIDEDARIRAIESIKSEGVRGKHLEQLLEIFSATENEVQVALNIAQIKWKNMIKNSGMVNDVGIALLVKIYLKHPHRWPVTYIKEPDLDALYDDLGRNLVPMLVGRSSHSQYRWKPEEMPKDHIKVLLSYLTECCERRHNKKVIDEYIEMVAEEGLMRGIDIHRDNSWTKSQKD